MTDRYLQSLDIDSMKHFANKLKCSEDTTILKLVDKAERIASKIKNSIVPRIQEQAGNQESVRSQLEWPGKVKGWMDG